MDIRELEQIIRNAAQLNPSQPALATLSSNGQIFEGLSLEFGTAVETLTERKSNISGRSILEGISAAWT